MPIVMEQTIWFPGIYHGRDDEDYKQIVDDVPLEKIVELVQKRAQEDGEWTIENGFVGENGEHEDKMRRMMEFVSDPKNIQQCTAHLYREDAERERDIDWVCRELATASKVMVR